MFEITFKTELTTKPKAGIKPDGIITVQIKPMGQSAKPVMSFEFGPSKEMSHTQAKVAAEATAMAIVEAEKIMARFRGVHVSAGDRFQMWRECD